MAREATLHARMCPRRDSSPQRGEASHGTLLGVPSGATGGNLSMSVQPRPESGSGADEGPAG